MYSILTDKGSGRDRNRLGYLDLKEKRLRPGDTLAAAELDCLGCDKTMVKRELERIKDKEIRVRLLNILTTLMNCGNRDRVLDTASNTLREVQARDAKEERVGIRRRQEEALLLPGERRGEFGRAAFQEPDNYRLVIEQAALSRLKTVEAMRELDG